MSPSCVRGNKKATSVLWLQAGPGGMRYVASLICVETSSNSVRKLVFSAFLLCMSLCPPLHPNYRDFLMDILLSPLSDPLLLLWDELLFVCKGVHTCVCVCVCMLHYYTVCMHCNWIGLLHTSSGLFITGCSVWPGDLVIPTVIWPFAVVCQVNHLVHAAGQLRRALLRHN